MKYQLEKNKKSKLKIIIYIILISFVVLVVLGKCNKAKAIEEEQDEILLQNNRTISTHTLDLSNYDSDNEIVIGCYIPLYKENFTSGTFIEFNNIGFINFNTYYQNANNTYYCSIYTYIYTNINIGAYETISYDVLQFRNFNSTDIDINLPSFVQFYLKYDYSLQEYEILWFTGDNFIQLASNFTNNYNLGLNLSLDYSNNKVFYDVRLLDDYNLISGNINNFDLNKGVIYDYENITTYIYNYAYNVGYDLGYNNGQMDTIRNNYNGLTYNDIYQLGYQEGYADGNLEYKQGYFSGLMTKQHDIFDNIISNFNGYEGNNNYYKQLISDKYYYQFLIPLNDFKNRTNSYIFLKCSFFNVSGTYENAEDLKNATNLLWYKYPDVQNKGSFFAGNNGLITFANPNENYDDKYLYVCFYLDNDNNIKYFYNITEYNDLMTDKNSIDYENITTIHSYNLTDRPSKKLLTITNDYNCYISSKSLYSFSSLGLHPHFQVSAGGLGGDSAVKNAYTQGKNIGTTQNIASSGLTNWFTGIFTAIGGFLSIQIGGITIGAIALIPLAISLAWFIIKSMRGGGA